MSLSLREKKMSAQENQSRVYLLDVSYDNLGCFHLRIGEEEPYVEGSLLQGNFAFKLLSSLCWSSD